MRDKMEYLAEGGFEMQDALNWVETSGQVTITSIKDPESNAKFHKIYISDDHKGHRIGTLSMPKNQGIKAVICRDCKAVCVYLFARDKVYSLEYLHKMVELKQSKIKNASSTIVAENYKHTIKCLKREIRNRKEK